MSLLKKLLLFLIALPTFIAFAHDVFMFYLSGGKVFVLNTAGFFWANVNPLSLAALKAGLSDGAWQSLNDALMIPGVYLFGLFALVTLFIVGTIAKRFEPEPIIEQKSRLDFLDEDLSGKTKTKNNTTYKYRKN